MFAFWFGLHGPLVKAARGMEARMRLADCQAAEEAERLGSELSDKCAREWFRPARALWGGSATHRNT